MNHLGKSSVRKINIEEIIKQTWALPRDIISDGYDVALGLLSEILPMKIHEYSTGTECFTWIIPEKWTCREARLEDLNGDILFSSRENPLHVMSYSLPYKGVVTREELFKHLYIHPILRDAIPFKFKYYERDWGLCCSRRLKEELKAPYYNVVIDSEFNEGTLKVGEVILYGKSPKSIVLCAHLCHPAQVNDDISGVAAGMFIMQQLVKRRALYYTYRFLILPETIGSAAWLSHNTDIIPLVIGGIFLEMLGTVYPLSLQHSLNNNSEWDRIASMVVTEDDKKNRIEPFMHSVLNDERMFNSPGINIPMVSLSRALPKNHPEFPYREYHSHLDDFEHVDLDNIGKACEVVLKIIDYFEKNMIPQPLFQGELFCSRYQSLNYKKMYRMIHSVPYYLNGTNDVLKIAEHTEHNFYDIIQFLECLYKENLVRWILK